MPVSKDARIRDATDAADAASINPKEVIKAIIEFL